MQNQRKGFSEKRNGDSSRKSNLEERLPKSTLYAENQTILQKIARREKRQQNSLSKSRFMQKTLHFFYVESLYSLDDEYSPKALVVMGYYTIEEDSYSELVASNPEIQAIYTSQPTLVSLASPIPIAQVHILLESYSRPTPVIPFLILEQQQQSFIPKYYLKNFGYLITRCSV